jgi:hypothetical protein
MDAALMNHIKEDRITPEAAYEKASDKSLFAGLIGKKAQGGL